MGAECVREATERVTHVVATDITDKTRWARSKVGQRVQCVLRGSLPLPGMHTQTLGSPAALVQGKQVVAPNWLWCCAYTWQRADEEQFPVKPGGGAAAAQASARSEAEDAALAAAAAGGGAGPDTGGDGSKDAAAAAGAAAEAGGGQPEQA